MVPDFALHAEGRETRLTELLHAGPWILIDATERVQFTGSLQRLLAEIRAVARTSAPESVPLAMLIRPDGHAAWVWRGHSDQADDLRQAIEYWFGRS